VEFIRHSARHEMYRGWVYIDRRGPPCQVMRALKIKVVYLNGTPIGVVSTWDGVAMLLTARLRRTVSLRQTMDSASESRDGFYVSLAVKGASPGDLGLPALHEIGSAPCEDVD
jgi:hypothetical protein